MTEAAGSLTGVIEGMAHPTALQRAANLGGE